MHYVMSDIHGEMEPFLKMLDSIEFSDDDILILLGDMINRGQNSISLLKYIKEKENMILIRGNHEQMLIDAYQNRSMNSMRMLCNNGGWQTRLDFEALSQEERRDLMEYLKSTPKTFEVELNSEKYHFVHSNYSSQNMKNFLKIMDDINWSPDEVTLVHGHTPTNHFDEDEKKMCIYQSQNLIAMDCGLNVAENGRLGCLCLETKSVYYI